MGHGEGERTDYGRKKARPKRSVEQPEPKPVNKGTPTTHYVPKKSRFEPMIRKMGKQNWPPRVIAKKLGVPLEMVKRVLADKEPG